MKTKGIAWIDVETTGIDAQSDRLLEIAAVLTDFCGNVVGEYFNEVIFYPDYSHTISLMDEQVGTIHKESALLEELYFAPAGNDLFSIDNRLVEWLCVNKDDSWTDIWFGGNSVFLDKEFVRENLPKFNHCLSHRSMDMTSVANFIDSNVPGAPFYRAHHKHRALSDITESIDEFNYYRKTLSR